MNLYSYASTTVDSLKDMLASLDAVGSSAVTTYPVHDGGADAETG